MISQSETPDDLNRPLAMAKQFAEARDNIKAARFYRLAGERAFAKYENDNALYCFQQALALTPDAQIENRYHIMFAIERVYSLASQPEARSENLISLAALADAIDDDQKRADVAARLALYKLDAGENLDVISVSRLAARIAQMAGAAAAEVALYLVWSRALIRLGDYDMAQGKLNKALMLSRAHALREEEGTSLRFLGVVSEENGRYAAAKTYYKQALAIYETINDKRGQSHTLNNLGKVAYDQGEFTAALRYWDFAQSGYQTIGDKPGSCRILINQSAICMDVGDYTKALQYSDEALSLSHEIQLRFGECLAMINIGLIHNYQTSYKKANEYGELALNLALKMKSKRLEGIARMSLAKAMTKLEKWTEATDQYWQALALWHELDQANLTADVQASLAEIALLTNNLSEAQTHTNEFLAALQNRDGLDGTESPFRIYLVGYQVLKAAKDSRANAILKNAYAMLQERAKAIVDDKIEQMFLEEVKVHHQIVSEYEDNK
ncbi:MAG: tetratricopeptide repeat protein [Chloroflexi bacterium]|nr:MAG: tetratricopeptide repeat protein [Chloroflexota bacterium]